jgi:hypothetical protein
MSHDPDDSFDRQGTYFRILSSSDSTLAYRHTSNGHSCNLFGSDFIYNRIGEELIYYGYATDLLNNYGGIQKHIACYSISGDLVEEVWHKPINQFTPLKYCRSNNYLLGTGNTDQILFFDCRHGEFSDSLTLNYNLKFLYFYKNNGVVNSLFGVFNDTAFVYQFDFILTDVETENEFNIPLNVNLSQNYPNPFNPYTVITYTIMKRSHVTLSIYNVLGQKVRSLINEYKNPGDYNVIWDGANDNGNKIASGIYFYQIHIDDFSITKKMTLIK